MDPAKTMSMAGDVPGLLTPAELDRLLNTLTASERAELSWSRPALAKVFDVLLTSPLNRDTLDASARMSMRVTLSLSRVGRKLSRTDGATHVFTAAVSQRRSRLLTFLGSEIAVAHAEQAARALASSVAGLLPHIPSDQGSDAFPQNDHDVDALIDAALEEPLRGTVLVQMLLGALLEAEDQGASPERGRDLARLALMAAVEGVSALRARGLTVVVEETGPSHHDEDALLAEMASKALRDTSVEAMRASQWICAHLPQPAERSSPALDGPEIARPRPRLTRYVGELATVQRFPIPLIVLRCSGAFKLFTATPELVEQAWTLHGAPVEALALRIPKVPMLGMVAGRLVRLDPASGEQATDAATRTRDMLRDWDEVLHRLAQ